MDFFKDFAGSVTKAVNFVVDKNRRAAMINRLKIVIRNEKELQARAYMELGKYYMDNLRDPNNETTEKLCLSVDSADRRLKRAFAKLDELIIPAGPEYDDEFADEEFDDSFESDSFSADVPSGGTFGGSETFPSHDSGPKESDFTAADADAPAEEDEFFRPFSEAKQKNDGSVSPNEEAANDEEPIF